MRKEYVYLIQDGDLVKIGRSYNPQKRLSQLRFEKAKDMKIIVKMELDSLEDSSFLEKDLHREFSHLRVRGEWFILNDEVKQYILDITEGLDDFIKF